MADFPISAGGAGGSDLYGDRSFLTFYKERGCQIYQATTDAAGVGQIGLVPCRTVNQHLIVGQDELAPLAGLNFAQLRYSNTLLKKGFVGETNWYVITSIGIAMVGFGRNTVTSGALTADSVITTDVLIKNAAVQGMDLTNFYSRAVGTLAGDAWEQVCQSASIDFVPAGSKCQNELGDVQQNPSGLLASMESDHNGMVMFNVRNVLDKGVLTMPRSQNGDNTQINFRFNKLGITSVPTLPCPVAVDATGQYVLIYELTYGGYFADVNGVPVNDDKAKMLAKKAADGIAS